MGPLPKRGPSFTAAASVESILTRSLQIGRVSFTGFQLEGIFYWHALSHYFRRAIAVILALESASVAAERDPGSVGLSEKERSRRASSKRPRCISSSVAGSRAVGAESFPTSTKETSNERSGGARILKRTWRDARCPRTRKLTPWESYIE